MLALFLSPSLAGSLLADDTSPPAPPSGLIIREGGEKSPAPPAAHPDGVRIPQGKKVDPCRSFAIFQLPLNWAPVDPTKQQGWITPKKQEGYQLCWAATTEMAVNFYGTNLPQCQQVNDVFFTGTSKCCPNSNILTISGCDNTRWDLPKTEFESSGFHVRTDIKITDWSQIKTYLCEKQSPFLYFFQPADTEHIILVRGYNRSVNHVFIVDPLDPDLGPSIAAYDFDDMFKGGENHTRDFLDICPEGAAAANGGSCP